MAALNRRQLLGILLYMKNRRKRVDLMNKAIAILLQYEEKRRIFVRQSFTSYQRFLCDKKDGGKLYGTHTAQKDFLRHLEWVVKHLTLFWNIFMTNC